MLTAQLITNHQRLNALHLDDACITVICEASNEERNELIEWIRQFSTDDRLSLSFILGTNEVYYYLTVNSIIGGIMSMLSIGNTWNDLRIFVDPRYRNRGYMNQFLDYLIAKGKRNDIKEINSTIRAKNESGVNNMINKGFEIEYDCWDKDINEMVYHISLFLKNRYAID
jgi:hypothetical protein